MRRVLAVVDLFAPGTRNYGYDLQKETGLRAGRLYPALHALVLDGALVDGWTEPWEDGRIARDLLRVYAVDVHDKQWDDPFYRHRLHQMVWALPNPRPHRPARRWYARPVPVGPVRADSDWSFWC